MSNAYSGWDPIYAIRLIISQTTLGSPTKQGIDIQKKVSSLDKVMQTLEEAIAQLKSQYGVLS